MENENYLQIAIRVARSGERERARDLFAEVVRREPGNAQAWLWLSELTNRLEEQTTMLEIAQEILSGTAGGECDVQTHLNAMRGAIPLPTPATPVPVDGGPDPTASPVSPKSAPDEQLFQANRLIILGKQEQAQELLADLAREYPQDEHILSLLNDLQSAPLLDPARESQTGRVTLWGKLKKFYTPFART